MRTVFWFALVVMLLAFAPWVFFPIGIYALWHYSRSR